MKKLLCLYIYIIFVSCLTQKQEIKTKLVYMPRSKNVIYRTKKDYSCLVPIQKDKAKTKILGYSSPSDLKVNCSLLLPIKIKDSYCLDRGGINQNTVFLNIDYETYSRLKKSSLIKGLKEVIIDENPLEEMYVCSNVDENTSIEELKDLVDNNCPNCKKIKL